jgi:hypothetical protein
VSSPEAQSSGRPPTIDELEVENEFLPAYQLNALGIRAGGRTALDRSPGIGYKGLLGLGLVHRF